MNKLWELIKEPDGILKMDIIYFDNRLTLACDGNCQKAWGINNRPRNKDDSDYLADAELGKAPIDPGTLEGKDSKPQHESMLLNKWCCRECERSNMGNPRDPFIILPIFSIKD